MRLGAIEALGTIRDQRSCKPLISLLEQDENAEVRWVAALALGSLGSPDAINPLVRALKDPDRYVRYGAAQALQSLSWVPRNDTERAYYAIAFQDWKHVAQIGAGATGPLIEILRTTMPQHGQRSWKFSERSEIPPRSGRVNWFSKIPAAPSAGKQSLQQRNVVYRLPIFHRGLSKRPRTGQNPWAAAILNFLFLGLGYNYLGYWWGFLVFMSYMSILVLSQMELGPFIPYLIVYPVTALFAVQTFFLAKRKEYM